MSSCKRWVTLASAGARRHPHPEPIAYLQFMNTGLLVGLPDEPGTLLDGIRPAARFVMRDTDAAGLGVAAEDLAAGVALCRSDGTVAGWRCEPVSLVIAEPAGEIYRPHGEVAPQPIATSIAGPARARVPVPFVPERRRIPDRPRMLVFVSAEHLHDGWLQRAAELAGTQDATVVLGAVGELPETALHAAEERAALTRMLQTAAHHFGGRVDGTHFELGGDPVHGLLTLAAETRADLIVVPDEASHFWGGVGLTRALGTRGDVPVLRVARAGVQAAAGRRVAARRDASGEGGRGVTLDCGWIELLAADGSGALARAHLFVRGVPRHPEPWRGHLDSLRLTPRAAEVVPGEYIIRFARGLQRLRVYVDVADGVTTIRGEDGELPAPLIELAEGE